MLSRGGQFHSLRNEDAYNVVDLLKACAKQNDLIRGSQIYEYIRKHTNLQKDSFVTSALVTMYARCGALAKAQCVLYELPARDVVTWNALIAGYTQHGQGEEALKCYDQMQHEGHSPDVVTFICALKACGSIRAGGKGEKIHDKIASLGILEKDVVLGNTLVDMYAKCGALAKAQQVLNELPVQDVVTWNALIAGYVQQGQGKEALKCFERMQREGYSPDAVTFISALKACGSIGEIAKGEKIHDKIVNLGMLKNNVVLGSTLVDMYARCGELAKARQVLFELPIRNVVTWTALITGYSQQGQGKEALKCLNSMQLEGHSPNRITFTCALKACGSIGAVVVGENIHYRIANLGMLERDVVLGNALVDMYAKCAALNKAQQVLNELPVRDVVTWNALIAGYVQQGQCEEALNCFDIMKSEGYSPNAVTFTCALKACGNVGASAKGEQIHQEIASLPMLKQEFALGGALVDMYTKCAALSKAVKVLEELPVQDVVIWNTLIGGHAQGGQSGEALNCFERMQSKRVKPDSTTLVCILNACSHSGLLTQAVKIFTEMTQKHGIEPSMEHYCCMVDLFARAGTHSKALMLIEKMPSTDYLPPWLALLGACRKWGDLKIGTVAFEFAFHLDKTCAAAHLYGQYLCSSSHLRECSQV